MTPDPTLTDEELAPFTEEELAALNRDYPAPPFELIPRLIAALRASREEVERLRTEASEWRRRIVP